MHPALLIDEILQLIFDFCSDLPKTEPKWTFAQLARCCHAWKDPALDRLWAWLGGIEPLLALLPQGYKTQDTPIPPASFLDNAARVRRITHAQDNLSASIFHDLSPILPQLETVALSFHGCMVPRPWTTSTRLKTVSINIGFSRSVQAIVDRSNAAASFLEEVRRCAPNLCTLQVRGRMSSALNQSVAALTLLRSLNINAHLYLAHSTLAAIATFPSLRIFEVHASHMQADEFEETLSGLSFHGDCFPALQELTIHTNGPLLAAVLTRIPIGTLTKLHVDMDKCLFGPSYMKPILELLAQKTSTSLRELTIEDRTDFDELELYPPMQGTPRWYTLDVLSPLARMKQLRRFVLRDPEVNDADLEHLAKWWPALEHLDLGTFDPEHSVPKWKVQMTPASYGMVAKFFPRLKDLALPSQPPTTLDQEQPQQPVLRSLTIGDMPKTPTGASEAIDASGVVDTLLKIFPSLRKLDTPATELIERFETVVSSRLR